MWTLLTLVRWRGSFPPFSSFQITFLFSKSIDFDAYSICKSVILLLLIMLETAAAAGLLHLGRALYDSSRPLGAAASYAAAASMSSLGPSLQAWALFQSGSLFVDEGQDDDDVWEGIGLLKKSMVVLRAVFESQQNGPGGETMDTGTRLMGVLMVLERGYKRLKEEKSRERTISLAEKNVGMIGRTMPKEKWVWFVYWRARSLKGNMEGLWSCVTDCEKRNEWVAAMGFALMCYKEAICDVNANFPGAQEVVTRIKELWERIDKDTLPKPSVWVLEGAWFCLNAMHLIRKGRSEEAFGLVTGLHGAHQHVHSLSAEEYNCTLWKWLAASQFRSLISHSISSMLRSTSEGSSKLAEEYAFQALRDAGVHSFSAESLAQSAIFMDAEMRASQKEALLFALIESLIRLKLPRIDMITAHSLISAASIRLQQQADEVTLGTQAAHQLLCGEYHALLGNRAAAATADAFFTSALHLTSLLQGSDVAEAAKTQKSLLTGVQRLPGRDADNLEEPIVNAECASAAWFAEAVYAARKSRVTGAKAALHRSIDPPMGSDGLSKNEQIIANALVMLSNIILAQGRGNREHSKKALELTEAGMKHASNINDDITKSRAVRQKMKVLSRKRKACDVDVQNDYRAFKKLAMEQVMGVMKKLGDAPSGTEWRRIG